MVGGVGRGFKVYGRGVQSRVGSAAGSDPNPGPDTRNPNPETRSPKPETRSPKPEARITQFEARNLKLETRNPKSQMSNPKPRTPNPKAPTPKPQQGGRASAKNRSGSDEFGGMSWSRGGAGLEWSVGLVEGEGTMEVER